MSDVGLWHSLGAPEPHVDCTRCQDVGLWHSLGASEPRVNRLIVPAVFWSGDGGAQWEVPGELTITGSHGEKSSKSVSQKVELMYRLMLTNKKLDNYNHKYCSCNGIVKSSVQF